MTDFMTPEQRSRAMSRVRGSETRLERLVRSELHKRGFRFRKNVKELPGRPDIVLPKYKAIVFVHGCFWHGHQECPAAKLPEANHEFWDNKITANAERDRRQQDKLRQLGWRIETIWGCSLKTHASRGKTLEKLSKWIRSDGIGSDF